MGAQLSLITPTASTVALQSYIDIIQSVQYSSTVNSSRFLKTVKCLDSNGFVIVKVLIKPDQLSLPYQDIIHDVEKDQVKLLNISNTLPFAQVLETERATYAIRPFIKSNLFDRLSTRPFLEKIEKNWIAFQLINAIQNCHQQGIIHGDLKTENIMITSWNWVLITDFEKFKPSHLPENSSQFSFYFDTSKRSNCYLAPERFDEPTKNGLTPEMDMFSVGCVLAELYLDGSPIFTLSQLFKYRKSQYVPNLTSIDDPFVRELIENLIQMNPKKRLSAEKVLNIYKSKIFHPQFYDFLYPFMESLSNFKINNLKNKKDKFQECDYRIDKIYQEFESIAQLLDYRAGDDTIESDARSPIPITLNLPGLPNYHPKSTSESQLNPMALIVLTMVLSAVRNTTHSSFRIKSCDLIIVLAEKLHDEAKLDRCLPYLIYLLEDPSMDVKAAALRCITQLLYMCDSISMVNISIWQEYILPKLQLFHNSINANDEADFIKLQFAVYLPYLMSQSTRFHEFTKILQKENKVVGKLNDKKSIMKDFENFTINLLTDSNPNVKISLLQNISELCQFFGRDKTNDLILSHLITYLNDKSPHLRVSFIESILPLSMFTGISSLEQYILPLLVQTINDPDELVVIKVLKNFTKLISIGMLKKHYLWDLVRIVIKLVLHPNEWIRESSLLLIITICETLSPADLYCILYPIIRPFFQYDVTVFTYESLSPCLCKPLTRSCYNLALNWAQTSTPDVSLFWQMQNNTNIDSFGNTGLSFMVKTSSNLRFNESLVISNNEIPISSNDKIWLTKLQHSGLLESEFWKLATLRDYIYRISRLNYRIPDIDTVQNIDLQKIGVMPKILFFNVYHKSEFEDSQEFLAHSPPPPAIRVSAPHGSSTSTLTSPIQLPVSQLNKQHHAALSPPQQLILGKTKKAAPSIHEDRGNAFANVTETDNMSVSSHNSATITISRQDSRTNTTSIKNNNSTRIVTSVKHNYKGKNPYILNYLSSFKFEPKLDDFVEFGPQLNIDNLTSNTQGQEVKPWTPKGTLVAHLLEHKSSCNCIAISPDQQYFITGDNDGVLKIWDSARLERNVTGNSSLSINLNSAIKSLDFLPKRDCFVVALKNGDIKVFRVSFEKNGKNRFNKLVPVREYRLINEFAIQVEIIEDILVMITSNSRIIGVDIKTMKELFVLQNKLSHGLPISFILDTKKKAWVLVSTSNGFLDLWDIRFELQVKSAAIGKQVHLKATCNDVKKLNIGRLRTAMMIGIENDITLFDVSRLASTKQPTDLNWDSYEEFKPTNQLEFIQHKKNAFMVSSNRNNELVFWDLKNFKESSFLIKQDDKRIEFTESAQNEFLTLSCNIIESAITKTKSKKKATSVVNTSATDLITGIKFISYPYEMIIVADRSGCINVYR